ncbi:flagellar hook-length control protein [Rhodococcus hoagii]|nr:flagellar hook-length control protein [Prescottella equi]
MTSDTITAVMTVARDVAEGTLSPDELAAVAAEECRDLFAVVVGPEDPLWPIHLEVARQVLATGGIPAGELTEWLAVARRAEGSDDDAAESTV